MDIEQTIKQLKVAEIDEMEWLKIRETADDPEAEKQALHHLGLSMRSPVHTTPHATPNSTATSLEDLILSTPIGQLAPIRVIRYPRELNRFGKDYGLIFGYRRWRAAKKQGLPTIHAQVVHLTPEEYHNPQVRFWLRMMGFTENTAREPLSSRDYYKTVRSLKEQYQAIYPEASKKSHHLKQDRNPKGHLKGRTPNATPGFGASLAKITKKSQRMAEKDIQIADLLNLEVFDDRYSQPINQSVALLLTQLPHDAQTTILNRLAKKGQPFTIKNIQAAINKYHQTHPSTATTRNNGDKRPTDTAQSAVSARHNKSRQFDNDASQHIASNHTALPDLDAVKTMTKVCLHLRSRFTWSLPDILEALPPFADMAHAADLLVDFLRQEKLALEGGSNKELKLVR